MFKSPAKNATVEVTVLPGNNPNYAFRSPDGIWDGTKLIFDNKGHNGFYVSFVIQNPDYYFAANMNAVLVAKKIVTPDDECPDQLPANQYPWDQFKPFKLLPGLKTLIVHDPNAPGHECQFGFSLFVTTNQDGSGPYLKVDPIGDNRNGSTGLNWLAVATTAIVVAAVAAFGIFKFALSE